MAAAGGSGGFISLQEHGNNMAMYNNMVDSSSSTSSSMSAPPNSMQAMAFNHMMIDPLAPVLDRSLNIFGSAGGGFYPKATTPSCLAQIGVCADVLYEQEPCVNDIGVAGDLYIPPLETLQENSISTTENYPTPDYHHREININNYSSNNDQLNNNSFMSTTNSFDNNKRVAENVAGVGNLWVEEDQLKLGEWDLEDLMKDVPSFPFLEFQP